MVNSMYTTQLQAGLGLIEETSHLLNLWEPGMSATDLYTVALQSGRFPNITARRLRNIVAECFAPRYLVDQGQPAKNLVRLTSSLSNTEFTQLLLLFTCRANTILGDFVRQVYWARYVGGYSDVTTDDARAFVERSMDDGKSLKRWSETTVRRVAAYLTGCCADYGMLERGLLSRRRILAYRISPIVAAYIAYDLHTAGLGDNTILAHQDWQLFGMQREDVLEEFKRLSLKGLLIVQAAGDVIHISWKFKTMEELCNVLAKG